MERYIISGRLGEGAHGIVLKGENGLPNSAVRELLALRLIRHEFVTNLIDYFPQGYSLVLVCEYLPLDFYEYLRSNVKPLDVCHVKSYLWMLASAIDYIHSLGIMHRDLKPANLLIGQSGKLKVADFGLCRIFSQSDQNQQFTHQVASRWYRAPELLYGSRHYGPAVDLWAMGCIFGEMLRNSPVFPGENDIGQLCTVIQVLGTPTENNWPGVSELPDFHKISFTETRKLSFKQILPDDVDDDSRAMLERFLCYSPQSRITAKQVLDDGYFKKDPVMTRLEEMPQPQKTTTSTTEQFTNWDWSSKDSFK